MATDVNLALIVWALQAAPGAPSPVPGPDRRWTDTRAPKVGPPLAIGGTSAGCLQGGIALPPSGSGYDAFRLSRNRNFGHPDLVGFIRRLSAAARKQGLGPLAVGDLALPRGGPTLSGHKSHQTGLDVDIAYLHPKPSGRLTPAERERLPPPAVVDLRTATLTPRWHARLSDLLAMAASDAAVDRIFVHPAIKRELCAKRAGAAWLSRIRPWWAHHDHFHARLRCPAGATECQPQDPLSAGDGCGDTLAWWWSDDARKERDKRAVAAVPPVLPPRCEEVLR